jgi:N-acetylneuraminic acid mutarotase
MKKVYVVVYVSVSDLSGDIYTEQKVTINKSVAQKYFNDYVSDVAETTSNEEILDSLNDSVFDYCVSCGSIYHVEISEVEVAE